MDRRPGKQCGTFPPQVRPALVRVVFVLVCWVFMISLTHLVEYSVEAAAALLSAVAALVSAVRGTAPDSTGGSGLHGRVMRLANL
jgi:hypothetical protein